ncbi:MAG: LLM class flavin-dependent oxidoreductase [Pseudomonadota bacterium]
MRFSISIPVQFPVGEPIERRFQESIEVVRAAREAGFNHISASQHYLATPFQYLQPVPILARMAAESGDMTLGSGIILLTLQHPVDMAESIATLDVITGGRLVFGVGLGYRDEEFDAFGVPKGKRLSRFLEALHVIERLWTEERVTHQGEHFQLNDVTLTTRPLQKPRPPIVLAASGDKMVRRAAKLADAWAIAGHATFATLERQVEVYKAALAEAGKPFPPERFAIGKEMFIGREMGEARKAALPHIETKYKAYAAWGQDNVLPDGESFDLPIDELMEDRFIVGDPEHCIEQIEAHRDRLGVRQIGFRLHWPGLDHRRVLDAISLIGERVIPHFR